MFGAVFEDNRLAGVSRVATALAAVTSKAFAGNASLLTAHGFVSGPIESRAFYLLVAAPCPCPLNSKPPKPFTKLLQMAWRA
ncbi:MAG: hypothetical protein KDI42_07740 [Gammaproteobacteria bacterium]|nr:hypothetical protein [Gammaproteobacteria bacterium]